MPREPLSLLLGIPSSVHVRRASIRCSILHVQGFCERCRLLFIVGRGGETAPDLHHADVLRVDVREAMQSYLPAHLAARRSGSLTATLTTYLKIAKFLEYAANATEQIIARVDDDVWRSSSGSAAIALAAVIVTAPYSLEVGLVVASSVEGAASKPDRVWMEWRQGW